MWKYKSELIIEVKDKGKIDRIQIIFNHRRSPFFDQNRDAPSFEDPCSPFLSIINATTTKTNMHA